MADAGQLSFRFIPDCDLAIVSPNDPGAMVQYAEECLTLGIRYIFDPGQQCARMSGAELRDGAIGAWIIVCNDYEFELLRQKTGLDEETLLEQAHGVIVTAASMAVGPDPRGPHRRARRPAESHRRSDWSGRCLSRRAHERAGDRLAVRGLRAACKRGCRL